MCERRRSGLVQQPKLLVSNEMRGGAVLCQSESLSRTSVFSSGIVSKADISLNVSSGKRNT